MPHEYTRQRQGRDFVNQHYIRQEEDKKSLLEKLKQHQEEAERNATPVDGHEPFEKGR